MTGTTDVSLDSEGSLERAAPRPSSLIEAMRSLGYTLETAVADLVDNSISHGATRIRIRFDWDGRESSVSIADNGCGMTEAQLVEAMRPGTHNPRDERAATDLGRFGLGLKTASFSQASRLTVTTRRENHVAATRIWDVPFMASKDDWLLLRDASPCAQRHAQWTLEQSSGTCVIWENLDRLVGDADVSDQEAHRAFMESAEQVKDHLEMVFGDFLAGPKALVIEVGRNTLKRWDPFLEDHDATQHLPPEPLEWAGHRALVRPFVLPHHSRLKKQEFDRAAGPRGWNAHQGFYIYRNRRLLVAGSWLSLSLTRDEHLKLARIRIDLQNDSDFDWKLDVKKSVASPPVELRQDLRRIARCTRERAQEVYRHRGRKLVASTPQDPSTVWEGRLMRGRTLFRINRAHPIVSALTTNPENGRALEALLKLIEQTVPLASIYIRHAEQPEAQPAPFEDTTEKQRKEMLRDLYLGLIEAGRSHSQAIASLAGLEALKGREQLLELLNSDPPQSPELD